MKTILATLLLLTLLVAACGPSEEEKYTKYLKMKIEFLGSEDCRRAILTPIFANLLAKVAREAGYISEARLEEAAVKFRGIGGEIGRLEERARKLHDEVRLKRLAGID